MVDYSRLEHPLQTEFTSQQFGERAADAVTPWLVPDHPERPSATAHNLHPTEPSYDELSGFSNHSYCSCWIYAHQLNSPDGALNSAIF